MKQAAIIIGSGYNDFFSSYESFLALGVYFIYSVSPQLVSLLCLNDNNMSHSVILLIVLGSISVSISVTILLFGLLSKLNNLNRSFQYNGHIPPNPRPTVHLNCLIKHLYGKNVAVIYDKNDELGIHLKGLFPNYPHLGVPIYGKLHICIIIDKFVETPSALLPPYMYGLYYADPLSNRLKMYFRRGLEPGTIAQKLRGLPVNGVYLRVKVELVPLTLTLRNCQIWSGSNHIKYTPYFHGCNIYISLQHEGNSNYGWDIYTPRLKPKL